MYHNSRERDVRAKILLYIIFHEESFLRAEKDYHGCFILQFPFTIPYTNAIAKIKCTHCLAKLLTKPGTECGKAMSQIRDDLNMPRDFMPLMSPSLLSTKGAAASPDHSSDQFWRHNLFKKEFRRRFEMRVPAPLFINICQINHL